MSDLLRELNGLLALATGFGLGYRTVQGWSRLASRGVYSALLPFPLLVGLGSVIAVAKNFPPNPIVPAFTAAYLILGYFLVFWPAALKEDPHEFD